MRDTTPEADAVLLEIRRGQTPEFRVRQALELSSQMLAMQLARLRALHPEADKYQLMERLHGIRLIRPSGWPVS